MDIGGFADRLREIMGRCKDTAQSVLALGDALREFGLTLAKVHHGAD